MSDAKYPRTFTFMTDGFEETVTFHNERQLKKGLRKRFGKRSPFHDLILPKETRKTGPRNQ